MLSTRDIADHYGVSPRRILSIAHARGIAPARTVGGHLWRKADLKRFKPGPKGWPKGRPRKTAQSTGKS